MIQNSDMRIKSIAETLQRQIVRPSLKQEITQGKVNFIL